MRLSVARFLIILTMLLAGLFANERFTAYGQTVSLQLGVPVERTLGRGQRQSFNVSVDQDQYLQVVVNQRGIDVVVRVFSPGGKMLGDFDTPNGSEGPENLSLIAGTSGVYRIDVAPLDQGEDVSEGRFEIKILELRAATTQELQNSQNQEVLKVKGVRLLAEVAENLEQIRLPLTRVRSQLQAAQLLWTSDQKLAVKLVSAATDGVREYLAEIGTDDEDYYQGYAQAMQLRHEVVQALGQHDPEMALAFLRSTSNVLETAGDAEQNRNHRSQELQFELSLASQITARDPKRALQIAEDTLKKGYSMGLLQIIHNLRTVDPELAAKLAKQIAAKLQGEKLLKNPEAAYLAINLLMAARSPGRKTGASPATPEVPLLSGQESRELFDKVLAEAMSYSAPPANVYSAEKDAVQNLLNSIRSMTTEIIGSAVATNGGIEKKIAELGPAMEQQGLRWGKYYDAINTSSTEIALEAVSQAPDEMRGQLYQNLAQKAAAAGDFERARQILKDHIVNPSQRQQALFNLDQQAIQTEAAKGRIVEALRIAGTLRTAKQRAIALTQIANLIGPGQKTATALNLLEQARNLIGSSPRGETQEQMNALLEIGRGFARYDSKRAFEVVEPLVDQFNEMSAAALVLNGFGQDYYRNGELILQDGNGVGNTATQLMAVLGALGMTNFDRAKSAADRVERPEVRIGAYLSIAQQAISPTDKSTPSRW